jgi:hypothetical protein
VFRPLLVALALLAAALPPLTARAAIPGADDPKAYTYHDLFRSRLEFNRRTLTGAYKQVGNRDFKWEDDAVRFLDAMAVYFTYGPAEPIYQTIDVPSFDDLQKLAKATEDAGCTDPLVQYCRAVILLDRGELADHDPAARLVERAVLPMAARKYPALRILAALNRVHSLWDSHLRYGKLAWDSALAAAAASDADLRHALMALEPFFQTLPRPRQLEFCNALLDSKTVNPWIAHLFFGRYEISAAWDARGTGWANSVTDEGWRGMYQHLAQARDHLVKAYELHPNYPEPADEMITVALGAGDRLNVTTRDWFDKAVKAQFDYYGAYNRYLYTLWPRWNGSHPEMFQFGLECLQTQRFDTYVPYKLWYAVQEINRDTDAKDFAILKIPEVQVALWQLFTTMGDKVGGKEPRDVYPSTLVAIKWRVGDYAAAARLMDKLGDRLDPAGFNAFRTWPPLAASEIRARTSAQAPALDQADTATANGDRDAAIAAYQRAATALGPDHPGARYVNDRLRALKFEKQFATGDWVDITPDASFAPWAPMAGWWDRDKDGAIVARADARGKAAFVCRADFGPAFEIRARLHPGDPKQPSLPVLLVHWGEYDWFHCGGIATGRSVVHARTAAKAPDRPFKYKGGELVTVRVRDSKLSVLVDGQALIEDRPAPPPPPGLDNYVGLGINGQVPGLSARFTDVQIRRLETPNDPTQPANDQ